LLTAVIDQPFPLPPLSPRRMAQSVKDEIRAVTAELELITAQLRWLTAVGQRDEQLTQRGMALLALDDRLRQKEFTT
jgi:hypothetical protein